MIWDSDYFATRYNVTKYFYVSYNYGLEVQFPHKNLSTMINMHYPATVNPLLVLDSNLAYSFNQYEYTPFSMNISASYDPKTRAPLPWFIIQCSTDNIEFIPCELKNGSLIEYNTSYLYLPS